MFRQREFLATPSAQLRELLGQLEAYVGKMEHDSREEMQETLVLFDAVQVRIVELERAGVSLLAEIHRFESVAAIFRRKAKTFLRKVGGEAGLAALRADRAPTSEQWWWFIDQWWAEQRKAQHRRQMKWLLIGAVALIILAVVNALLSAPNKATFEIVKLQQAAEQLAQAGDYTAALNTVDEALALSPGDANLLAFKGILQTEFGLEAEAATTFTAAEAASGSSEQFFLNRAQIYMTLGLSEAVLADAQAAIAANPQSARGYLYLAQANTDLGNFSEAEMQYDEAGRLADEVGDSEIAAIARVQKAFLYQQLFIPTPAAP